jgi:ankyrin repeat protein
LPTIAGKVAASQDIDANIVHCLSQPGIDHLLDMTSDVDVQTDDGYTPLHLAAEYGHLATVKQLLGKGAKPDGRARDGCTPIHLAALSGHSDVIDHLLDLTSDVDVQTDYGYAPLHLAAENGHSATVKQLLGKGAKLSIQGKDGQTPLHLAAQNGHSSAIECLLHGDFDLNIKSRLGMTALHLAVYKCDTGVIRPLIEGGANPYLPDLYGRSSLDWAVRHTETFNCMGEPCKDYTPTDVVLQKTRLKSLIVALLNLLEDDAPDSDESVFHYLGHCLLFSDDEGDARIAFAQRAKLENGTLKHEAWCNLCGPEADIIGQRYVCRSCPDVDLCYSCKGKYDSGFNIPGCEQHSFVSVPCDFGHESCLETLKGQRPSIGEWLMQLKCKYA